VVFHLIRDRVVTLWLVDQSRKLTALRSLVILWTQSRVFQQVELTVRPIYRLSSRRNFCKSLTLSLWLYIPLWPSVWQFLIKKPPTMAESLYSDSFIDPDIVQSDDLPNLPSSQPTVAWIPTSHFTSLSSPARLSHAPKSLERIGPPLRKFWVLYPSESEMEHSRKQFVEWWLTTGFGMNPQCRDGLH
jgi:hypothetical protein